MPDLLHGFGSQLLQGAVLTIIVTFASLILGTVLGLIGAVGKLNSSRWLSWPANLYTTVVRGVPDLLIIFIIFFGGTITLTAIFGRYVEIDAFWSGVTALGIVFGAYATEIFRGAIQSVPKGQSEAAMSMGLQPLHRFFLVVVPQAWRIALPAYGNQLLVLTKQTSLISIVGLEELLRKGKIAVGATDEPFTFYVAVGIIYLIITGSISILLKRAEKSAERGLART